MFLRRLVDAAFVAAFLLTAVVLFVWLHSGEHGNRVCYAVGSGGPGSLSVWPPGSRCWVSDEGSEPAVVISKIFPWALAGTWMVIAGLYLFVRRRRHQHADTSAAVT